MAMLASCSDSDAEAGAVADPASGGTLASSAEPPVLDCTAAEFYRDLADLVTPFQAIRRGRPQQDTYEEQAAYAVRLAAWEAAAGVSADSVRSAASPLIVRREVAAFRYDAGTRSIIVEDFGPLAVPGVIVEADLRLPYPALNCMTGPFFECATHTSEDSWRTAVVERRVPLTTGADARIPLPAESAEAGIPGPPLEFEAAFALVSPEGQDPLLPSVALRSIRLLADGEVVAVWEGTPTLAGRTTLQRMLAFAPEEEEICSPAASVAGSR
jgi:hypothetical protein